MDVAAMQFPYATSVVGQKQFDAHIKLYACVIIEPTRRSQQNQGFREVGHYVTYHTAGAVSATEKN